MKELTKLQMQRQDFVDNNILYLLNKLTNGAKVIEHNQEHISEIRDAIQNVIVDKLNLMTEMQFYPYIKDSNETT